MSRSAFLKFLMSFFLSAMIMAGCAPIDRGVHLTYERFVNTSGGSGRLFITRPAVRYSKAQAPAGNQVLGRSEGADIITRDDPVEWVLAALADELTAAGYEVKTGPEVPADFPKVVQPAIIVLSVSQVSNVFTVSTTAEVKLEAQLFRNGQLIKTLTSGSRDEEEGFDRSSEAIRWTLEKTLQQALQELVPYIVKTLE